MSNGNILPHFYAFQREYYYRAEVHLCQEIFVENSTAFALQRDDFVLESVSVKVNI